MENIYLVIRVSRFMSFVCHAASSFEKAYQWAREHGGTAEIPDGSLSRDGMAPIKIGPENRYEFRCIPVDTDYKSK